MTEAGWIAIEATLMTSQAIEAYGGVQFSRESLEMAAASLNTGSVPMQADHNAARPVRVRHMRAWVDDGREGFYRLRLSYEIHPDDAHYVTDRGGMSVAMRSPLDGREAQHGSAVAVELSADNAWFDDDALLEAESLAVAAGVPLDSIRIERVYQFSFVPDPQIFLTLVLPLAGTIATGALGGGLWDAVKLLFQKRRTPSNGKSDEPTRVNLRLVDGDRSLTGIVETPDDLVAARAIDAFEGIAREFIASQPSTDDPTEGERRLLLWDDAASSWMPHSPGRTGTPLSSPAGDD